MAWITGTDRDHYRMDDMPPDDKPTDREVKSTVVHRLRENPYTQDGHIKVRVHGGVVELDGEVPSPMAEQVAVEDAWTIPGVLDVNADLVVREAA